MGLSGQLEKRRAAYARGLKAFGVSRAAAESTSLQRVVREGADFTLFTIGYERRTGSDLITALREAGVEYLADVRKKPISRKPGFGANALRQLCDEAGIEYASWTELGSTEEQRDRLRATGDLARFHKNFRRYAAEHLEESIGRLSEVVGEKTVALLCYERAHEDCHRSVVADLVAARSDAGITAIL